MKKIFNIFNNISQYNIVLIFILVLSLFFRVFLINKVPPSLSNDEVVYAYDAFSLAKTGKDVLGRQFPLSFIADQKVPFVPIYIMAFFLVFLPLNIFTVKLPFIISGVIVVLLTYKLAKALFNSSKIGIISAALMAISPWHLQISRTAYEINFALLFYILAILLFFRKRIFLSLIPFFLAYHSYQGTKIILLPLVILLAWYHKNFFKNNRKKLFLFLSGTILIFFSFYFIGKNNQGLERIDQLIFFNQDEAAQFVNYERRTSSASILVKKIFNNKGLYYFRMVKEKYFAYFNFLFNNGEQSGLYSLWFRGNQYLIDLLFLISGCYFLYKNNKKRFYFLIAAILVTTLPSILAAGKISFGTRSLVSLPFLIIILSVGIFNFFKKNNKNKVILLAIIYLCFFSSFFYQYYYRYPIYSAENWYYSDQKAVEFIINKKNKRDKIIITHSNASLILRYAFTKKLNPQIIQKVFKRDSDVVFENLEFVGGCPNKGKGDPLVFLPENSILLTKWDWDCYKEAKASKEIRALDDNRIIWRTYEKD